MKIKGRSALNRGAELLLMVGGAALLVAFFAADLWAQAGRAEAIAGFAQSRAPAANQSYRAAASEPGTETEDATLALLRIRRVKLQVPVFDGTDESVLRRGAGFIEGTAQPGTGGNVGIAAHRDRDFRPLQHVRIGDVVELETSTRTHTYRVTNLTVVEPEDIQVLDDTGEAVLTLVTCFPFYFAGSAPQRFIVRALAVSDSI